jgi:hypothetical protein
MPGNYIQAVEAADEIASPGPGALEPATRSAINKFVIGCKLTVSGRHQGELHPWLVPALWTWCVGAAGRYCAYESWFNFVDW